MCSPAVVAGRHKLPTSENSTNSSRAGREKAVPSRALLPRSSPLGFHFIANLSQCGLAAFTQDFLVARPPLVTSCTPSTRCVRNAPVQSRCCLADYASNGRRRRGYRWCWCWRGGISLWFGLRFGFRLWFGRRLQRRCGLRRRCWRDWLGSPLHHALRRRALACIVHWAPIHISFIVAPCVVVAIRVLHARALGQRWWCWRHWRHRGRWCRRWRRRRRHWRRWRGRWRRSRWQDLHVCTISEFFTAATAIAASTWARASQSPTGGGVSLRGKF